MHQVYQQQLLSSVWKAQTCTHNISNRSLLPFQIIAYFQSQTSCEAIGRRITADLRGVGPEKRCVVGGSARLDGLIGAELAVGCVYVLESVRGIPERARVCFRSLPPSLARSPSLHEDERVTCAMAWLMLVCGSPSSSRREKRSERGGLAAIFWQRRSFL